MQVNSLHPYKSFILASFREGTRVTSIVSNIIGDVEKVLDADNNPNITHHGSISQISTRNLDVGVIHYSLSRSPSWTDEAGITDLENHLFLLARKRRYACMYASDSKLKSYISLFVFGEEFPWLRTLVPINEEDLNAAFVTGQTRTLWLSGTHRRTTVKADNKILAGINLRDALDPLDDQSFHFTSARSLEKLGDTTTPVGVTPRKSRLWMGLSVNWADVCKSINDILDTLLSGLAPVESPFGILASTVKTTDRVGDPFDVAIIPPELGVDDPAMSVEEKEFLERWGYKASYEVISFVNNVINVEPYLDANKLGRLSIKLKMDNTKKVRLEVSEEVVEAGCAELMKEVAKVFRKVSWVKIWFESGHTLCDGAIFDIKHRDIPFSGYEWIDFGNYDISKEKPGNLADIGNSDSLFCWVKNHWPIINGGNPHPGAWLASDDGAGEIADFVFFDPPLPLISLIHVKGAHSPGPNREVSVADYQVVTAQAIKNLRFLDREALTKGLRESFNKQVGRLVWNNRAPANRRDMINAIITAGSNCKREVVILQPRHSKSLDDAARATPDGDQMARLRQLDTLLIGAENDCHSLGAPMRVLCEE